MLQQLIAVNCSSAKVVRTDCKSAMKIVRQGRVKPVNKQRMEMLRITGQKHRLGWVKSHPEKVNADRNQWTDDMAGIDKADAAAGNDWKRYRIDNTDPTGSSISDTTALHVLRVFLQKIKFCRKSILCIFLRINDLNEKLLNRISHNNIGYRQMKVWLKSMEK